MTPPPEERGHPVPVLVVAVMAVSAAAVLVRLAEGVHPIAAGFWRATVVAVLLLGVSLARGQVAQARAMSGRHLALIVLAGGLLAGHFWAWFASLHMTTVLRSTALVCLNPIWAGLFEWLVLRRYPGGRFFGGVGIAILGVLIMSGGSLGGGGADALLGDGLALLGGLLGALYLLTGRIVRPHVGIDVYGTIVCAACALWLLPAALVTGAGLTGFSTQAWLALAGLAFGPQLLGHIGFNYAVRYVPAATVAAVTLLEPAGAAALGAVVLGEVPGSAEIAGALVAIAGVGVATVKRSAS